MGDLRDRLRQVVAGFSQVAGSVCRGALVQGEPWNVEGAADTLLHHFRQQSKEFGFRCEAGLPPEAMGCIGRVFRSGEAEFYQDVQALELRMYLRAAAASACRVRATLLVPLFDAAGRGAGVLQWADGSDALVPDRPFAVLEMAVAQANPYGILGLYMWMRDRLSMLGLYVPEHISRTFDMAGRAPERGPRGPPGGPPSGARPALGPSPGSCSSGGAHTGSPAGATGMAETLRAETLNLALVCCPAVPSKGHSYLGTPPGLLSAAEADTPGSGSEAPAAGTLHLALALVEPAGAERDMAGQRGDLAPQPDSASGGAAQGDRTTAAPSSEGTTDRAPRLSSSEEPDQRSCGGTENSPLLGPSAESVRACLSMSLDAAAAHLGCRPSALIRACRRHGMACPRWVRPTCSVSAVAPRRPATSRAANPGDFVPRRASAAPAGPNLNPGQDPSTAGCGAVARARPPSLREGGDCVRDPGLGQGSGSGCMPGLYAGHAAMPAGAMSPPAAPPTRTRQGSAEAWQQGQGLRRAPPAPPAVAQQDRRLSAEPGAGAGRALALCITATSNPNMEAAPAAQPPQDAQQRSPGAAQRAARGYGAGGAADSEPGLEFGQDPERLRGETADAGEPLSRPRLSAPEPEAASLVASAAAEAAAAAAAAVAAAGSAKRPPCGGSSERSDNTGLKEAGACAEACGSGAVAAADATAGAAADAGGARRADPDAREGTDGRLAAQGEVGGCGDRVAVTVMAAAGNPKLPVQASGAVAAASVSEATLSGRESSGGGSGWGADGGDASGGALQRITRGSVPKAAPDPNLDPNIVARASPPPERGAAGQVNHPAEPAAAGPLTLLLTQPEQAPGRLRKRKSQQVLSGAARVAACLPESWAASQVGQTLTLTLPPGGASAAFQPLPTKKRRAAKPCAGGPEVGDPPVKKRRGRPPKINPETGLPAAKRRAVGVPQADVNVIMDPTSYPSLTSTRGRGRGSRGSRGRRPGRGPGRGSRVCAGSPFADGRAGDGGGEVCGGDGSRDFAAAASTAGRRGGRGRGRGGGRRARGARESGQNPTLSPSPVDGLAHGRMPRAAAAAGPAPDFSDSESDSAPLDNQAPVLAAGMGSSPAGALSTGGANPSPAAASGAVARAAGGSRGADRLPDVPGRVSPTAPGSPPPRAPGPGSAAPYCGGEALPTLVGSPCASSALFAVNAMLTPPGTSCGISEWPGSAGFEPLGLTGGPYGGLARGGAYGGARTGGARGAPPGGGQARVGFVGGCGVRVGSPGGSLLGPRGGDSSMYFASGLPDLHALSGGNCAPMGFGAFSAEVLDGSFGFSGFQ